MHLWCTVPNSHSVWTPSADTRLSITQHCSGAGAQLILSCADTVHTGDGRRPRHFSVYSRHIHPVYPAWGTVTRYACILPPHALLIYPQHPGCVRFTSSSVSFHAQRPKRPCEAGSVLTLPIPPQPPSISHRHAIYTNPKLVWRPCVTRNHLIEGLPHHGPLPTAFFRPPTPDPDAIR